MEHDAAVEVADNGDNSRSWNDFLTDFDFQKNSLSSALRRGSIPWSNPPEIASPAPWEPGSSQ
jgi:hypothetical protein